MRTLTALSASCSAVLRFTCVSFLCVVPCVHLVLCNLVTYVVSHACHHAHHHKHPPRYSFVTRPAFPQPLPLPLIPDIPESVSHFCNFCHFKNVSLTDSHGHPLRLAFLTQHHSLEIYSCQLWVSVAGPFPLLNNIPQTGCSHSLVTPPAPRRTSGSFPFFGDYK